MATNRGSGNARKLAKTNFKWVKTAFSWWEEKRTHRRIKGWKTLTRKRRESDPEGRRRRHREKEGEKRRKRKRRRKAKKIFFGCGWLERDPLQEWESPRSRTRRTCFEWPSWQIYACVGFFLFFRTLRAAKSAELKHTTALELFWKTFGGLSPYFALTRTQPSVGWMCFKPC